MAKNNLELNEFIDQLFVCINDISPLVNRLNVSISEAIHPASTVSENISKVSEANELATIDIMNMLDDTSEKCSTALASLNDLKNSTLDYDVAFLKATMLLIENNDNQTAIELLKGKINSLDEGEKSMKVAELEAAFNTIIMNAQGIMMALQVQDITTQQLAAIDNTVSTIQTKINSILKMSANVDTTQGAAAATDLTKLNENIAQLHREVVFDPKAINNMGTENNQDDVDELLAQFAEANSNAEKDSSPISQDDIDALFTGGKDEDDSSPISQDDIDAKFCKYEHLIFIRCFFILYKLYKYVFCLYQHSSTINISVQFF